jgi:hypothetical protein
MIQRPPLSVFVLMSNTDFANLSQDKKAAYLAQAAEALRSGKAMATPNGEFDDEDSLD